MRSVLMILLGLLLMACAPRANVELVTAEPGVGTELPIFVGTTRSVVSPGQFSDIGRGSLSFARYVVSIPPEHEAGRVEVAGRTPAPREAFVTRSVTPLSDAAYKDALRREMRRQGTNEVVLFVHGFNNTLADGMYRLAQMKHDLEIPGVPVHYSWPSAANPIGYVRDRDSALYSREGLIGLLNETADAGARRIILVAHSMGSFLSMETMIWMQQTGPHPGFDRLAGVVLLSPDIDVDLFKSQASQIEALPEPFFIFTSTRDRALRLSARLTGETDRLGTLTDPSRVGEFDVALIDVSNLQDSISPHLAAVSSPTMIELLQQGARVESAFVDDPSARIGLLPGTAVSVRNATAVAVAPLSVN